MLKRLCAVSQALQVSSLLIRVSSRRPVHARALHTATEWLRPSPVIRSAHARLSPTDRTRLKAFLECEERRESLQNDAKHATELRRAAQRYLKSKQTTHGGLELVLGILSLRNYARHDMKTAKLVYDALALEKEDMSRRLRLRYLNGLSERMSSVKSSLKYLRGVWLKRLSIIRARPLQQLAIEHGLDRFTRDDEEDGGVRDHFDRLRVLEKDRSAEEGMRALQGIAKPLAKVAVPLVAVFIRQLAYQGKTDAIRKAEEMAGTAEHDFIREELELSRAIAADLSGDQAGAIKICRRALSKQPINPIEPRPLRPLETRPASVRFRQTRDTAVTHRRTSAYSMSCPLILACMYIRLRIAAGREVGPVADDVPSWLLEHDPIAVSHLLHAKSNALAQQGRVKEALDGHQLFLAEVDRLESTRPEEKSRLQLWRDEAANTLLYALDVTAERRPKSTEAVPMTLSLQWEVNDEALDAMIQLHELLMRSERYRLAEVFFLTVRVSPSLELTTQDRILSTAMATNVSTESFSKRLDYVLELRCASSALPSDAYSRRTMADMLVGKCERADDGSDGWTTGLLERIIGSLASIGRYEEAADMARSELMPRFKAMRQAAGGESREIDADMYRLFVQFARASIAPTTIRAVDAEGKSTIVRRTLPPAKHVLVAAELVDTCYPLSRERVGVATPRAPHLWQMVNLLEYVVHRQVRSEPDLTDDERRRISGLKMWRVHSGLDDYRLRGSMRYGSHYLPELISAEEGVEPQVAAPPPPQAIDLVNRTREERFSDAQTELMTMLGRLIK